MPVVKLTCSFCQVEFERSSKNIKKGVAKQYCTYQCSTSQKKIDQSDKYSLVRYAYSKARRRAKADNIYFDVTIEYVLELWEKQNGICALSGEKITFGDTRYEKSHGFTTASLDRIDSCGSYVEGNIQWVHKAIQQMKFNLNERMFKYWCKRVVAWMGQEEGLDKRPEMLYNETGEDETPF